MAGIYGLTGDMIARQLSLPLLVFLLRHRDKMSFADILGEPFSAQDKEFQSEYLRISEIYQIVKTSTGFDMPTMLQPTENDDD